MNCLQIGNHIYTFFYIQIIKTPLRANIAAAAGGIIFFMLYLLGLDSQFALIETVLTSFYDFVPKAKKFKALLVFILCASCFLMSLPCVSYSGAFVFQIMDDYGGRFPCSPCQ